MNPAEQRVELLPNLGNEYGYEYGQELAALMDKELLHQSALRGEILSVPVELFNQGGRQRVSIKDFPPLDLGGLLKGLTYEDLQALCAEAADALESLSIALHPPHKLLVEKLKRAAQ